MKKSQIAVLTFVAFCLANAMAEEQTLRNRIKIKKKSELLHQVAGQEGQDLTEEKRELLAQKRRSLILDIKRFLRESHSEDQKAELNLRLGALFMEDYYSHIARAQTQFEKETQQYLAIKNKKGVRPPKLDNSEAFASLDRARAIYKDLSSRFPNHPRRDEMFFFLASASLDRGQNQEGMDYLRQLTERYPNSKYSQDALIQLGDHYFEQNKFQVAEGYYDRIIQKKVRSLAPYAIYKKAWCEYNTQRGAAALQHFKWVIANEDKEELRGSQVRVRNEALRDITLPFVDLKLVDESIEFFKGQGDPHNRRGFETMASLYAEQGNYKNAIIMNETLLELDANYAKNPHYDISIIDSLKMSGQRDVAVQRLFARLPLYIEASTWYEINSGNPEVVRGAVKDFEETARKFAFEVHAEGQRTKNDNLYNTAKLLYEKYLESFPRTAHASQVRFYLAEILYKQEKYLASADHYYLVYKDNAAGTLRFDSIRYTLNALDHELNAQRKKAGLSEISSKSTSKLKDPDTAILEQTPYTEVEQKFINVATEFLGAYPQAKESPDVLYQQAYVQYVHYDFGSAYKSFWQLVQQYPKHTTAYPSAYLIMDVLNRRKDYAKLVLACQKFLATKEFSKDDFKVKVGDVLRHAELKRIQPLEEKGTFKEAGDAYVEYTKAYGTQDEALFEKALYNASVNYGKANALLAAVETQEKFLRRFPKSNMRENMLLQVAKTHETLANFEKSATYFEMFAQNYPKNPQARTALRLAGIYYWGAGNAKKGESVMQASLSTYGKDAKVVERDLLDLYDSQGATDKQISFYLNRRSQKGVPVSQYLADTVKISELQLKLHGRVQPKLMDEALKVSERYRKDLLQTPKGIQAMSKVLLWYTNQKEDVFYHIKLTLPQKKLEVNLQRKLALLKELEKEYSHIASLGGGEWGIASIYKTASAYRHMAQDVAEAPVPSELTAEQLEMYRGELKKQMVKPFNEKSLALTQQCLDKAQEFNVYTTSTSKCYSLAGELEPQRYPLIRTFYLPPVQVATMVPNAEESKIALGNYRTYIYPYGSQGLFGTGAQERSLASLSPVSLPNLYDNARGSAEGRTAIPSLTNFRALADERKTLLGKAYDSERPSDPRKTTFSFLNLMRFQNPQKAASSILEAIQQDPQNMALHNLLGLAYLDGGNYPAAKVSWLSMIVLGAKDPAIWNNLGVVAYLEGNESGAIEYFNEAAQLEGAREAFTNLGFIALKYRNGFEAKKHFEKTLDLQKEDVTAQIGLGVARLQNREIDQAKEHLIEVAKKYKTDPYARLSLGYFLIDIEKDNDVARQILSEYMHHQSLDGDVQFREAIQETKNVAGNGTSQSGALPAIE